MQSDCAPRRRHRVRERREHSMRTRCPPQAARTRAHTEGLPHSHSRACPPCMWRGTWGTWNLEVERVRRLRRRARAGAQCGRICNLLSFVRSERFRAAVAAGGRPVVRNTNSEKGGGWEAEGGPWWVLRTRTAPGAVWLLANGGPPSQWFSTSS